MGKADRQRQLARQRAERQAARRAEQRKRTKRNILASSGVVITVLALVGILALAGVFDSKAKQVAVKQPGTTCTYTAKPDEDTAGKNPGLPPKQAVLTGTLRVTFTTSRGPIEVALNADKAPCSVGAMVDLINKKFYDNTTCHRVSTSKELSMLQCGDPTGTGSGGPGYTSKDENLTGATYTRGTVAMANAGPNTQGSQFFLVDKDSELPPSYTPIGTISSGIENLDKVIAVGTKELSLDGPPATPVKIVTATLSPA